MDQALKFVVDVQNSEAVKRLTADINQQKDSIAALNAQLQKGAISEAQFNAAAMPLGQNIAHATDQLKQIPTAATSAGRGLSQLAYAVDDIQYGFNAIVNNIPQIVLGLGGGAGVAGAAGIAAVAINQLYKHWGELTDSLQEAWSGVPAKQLEELREKAEAAAKAFEKLAETPTRSQEAQAKGVAGAITEAETGKALKGAAEAIGLDPGLRAELNDQENKELSAALWNERENRRQGNIKLAESSEKTAQELQGRVVTRNEEEARRLLGESTEAGPKGDKARATLSRLAQQHPGNFPEGFAQDVLNQSPERQKEIAQKRLEAEGQRNNRKAEEKLEAEVLSEKQQQAAWEKEGRKNDREMVKKLAQQERQEKINALQDERTAAQERHHQQDLALEQRKEQLGHPTQILDGAKAVVDMYQKAAGDAPLVALAKETKKIQEDQRKELIEINKKLEKERRVRPS